MIPCSYVQVQRQFSVDIKWYRMIIILKKGFRFLDFGYEGGPFSFLPIYDNFENSFFSAV